MYFGPGSGPMLAAAAAWDALAIELSATATGYGSIVSELTSGGWLGPASLSMAAAAAPHVAWLHSTAAQAEQTAIQAKEAAAAYELAFAMTVPPPVIAANRSLLMALVATNFFGQNTPAIAATEAHYAEMWIQDAAAMYGYAGSSAAAIRLTPFVPPQPTTDPTGLAAQSGTVVNAVSNAAAAQPTTLPQLMSATPAALQQLAAPAASLSPSSTLSTFLSVTKIVNTVFSTTNAANTGRSIVIQDERLAFQEARDAEKSALSGGRLVSTAPVRGLGPPVSAGMGRASAVGSLSVPANWTTAAPEIRTAALTLPESVGATPATATNMPPVPGNAFSQSVLGTLSRYGFDGPRAKSKPVIVRSPAAG